VINGDTFSAGAVFLIIPNVAHVEVWNRSATNANAQLTNDALDHPADTLPVYERLDDEQVERADRRAYRSAAWILKRAQAAAQAADMHDEIGEHLARLRDQHRRRPTLIAILDRAGLP
jgi:hypothetical protein